MRRREDVWVVRMALLLSSILVLQPAAIWAAQEVTPEVVTPAANPSATVEEDWTLAKSPDWAQIALQFGLFGITWAALAIPAYLLFQAGGVGAAVVTVATIFLPPLAFMWVLPFSGTWDFTQAIRQGKTSVPSIQLLTNAVKPSIFLTAAAWAWFLSQGIYDRFFKAQPNGNTRRDPVYRVGGVAPVVEGIGS